MLARLEQEEGIDAAAVDRRGERLRLAVRTPDDVPKVLALLETLGFAASVADDGAEARWYAADKVGELSREEGEVIARRVVPEFARRHGMPDEGATELTELTAAALHECFTSHLETTDSLGSLHTRCGRAVERATTARIGRPRAAQLGDAVEADLRARSQSH